MANLSAHDFMAKLASDLNFRSQIGISDSMQLEDLRAKAAAAGFNFSNEELLAAAQTQETGALSDDALDNVSGGTKPTIFKPILVRNPDIRF